MAGQMPLEHPVVVQIHCPQPLKPPIIIGRFRFKRLGVAYAGGASAYPFLSLGMGFSIRLRLAGYL
jgi:hypothetical protein